MTKWVVNSGCSRTARIVHLLRCLFYIRTQFQVELWAVHTPGIQNSMADAILHNNLHYLFSQASGAQLRRVDIPPGGKDTTGRADSRLDIPNLGPVVQELFSAGLAPTYQRNYKTGTKQYVELCREMHIHTPFPVTESILSQFVAWLHTQSLASSTVKNYLAVMRHAQIALKLGDPHMASMPQLEHVIRGIKRRSQALIRNRLPITPEILRGMR